MFHARKNILITNTNIFLIDLITNELNSTAPIKSILFSLAKEKFCDISGWPISKLSWTSLSDDDILDRSWVEISFTYCFG
ncbi:group II intron reverse transcriptase/maturase [Enterobacter hormaechei]|uniref:group II intron reverse transcriptase/maturase n=1 Tax=Enterobacter hormaechei TaxID=158836 RepID=UPI003CC6BB2E